MSYRAIVKNLPQELQSTILELIESIEDNLRAQLSVRREDFDQLQAALAQLAGAQTRTEQRIEELVEAQKHADQRVGRLENIVAELNESQQRTEQALRELAEAQKQTEQRVGRLETAVIELAEAQKQTEQRVGRLETAIVELTEAQKQTEQELRALTVVVGDSIAEQRKLRNLVGDHAGLFLELRYEARPHAYFAPILRRVHNVPLTEIEDKLETVLSDQEMEDLALLDLIVRGRTKSPLDPREVWLAVEISATIDRHDVERAKRRAELLQRAGYPAVPTVAGNSITQGGIDLAESEKVAVVQSGVARFWAAAAQAALQPA